MSTDKRSTSFVIYGEPASKANNRRLATINGKPRFIKSKKAISYVHDFARQCPQMPEPFSSPVRVTAYIYYRTRRPDLDESVILDCMQSAYAGKGKERVRTRNNIYENDRLVREKHIFWRLDPDNPRAEITVEEIDEP